MAFFIPLLDFTHISGVLTAIFNEEPEYLKPLLKQYKPADEKDGEGDDVRFTSYGTATWVAPPGWHVTGGDFP